MRILFVGDPHGDFGLVREHGPEADAIVLLGDLCCERPLKVELGDLAGRTWFILGNHDGDDPGHMLATLDLAERNLHGRVMDICGLRVAGLGGVFRGQVWLPDRPDRPGELRWRTRAEYLAATNPRRQWMGGPPAKHWCSIWPEDVDALLAQGPADVLVCHEAPESHRHGFRVLGDLARGLGARLLVHGHHHHDIYQAELKGGVQVVGVGLAGARDVHDREEGLWWLDAEELR